MPLARLRKVDEFVRPIAMKDPKASGDRWILTSILAWTILLFVFASADAAVPARYTRRSAEWLASEEGRRIADNVVTWQSPHGSWPKNGDTASQAYAGQPEKIAGTFDNGATTGELRFLARAFVATSEPRYQAAFVKGLDHILEAQYRNGGWPQRYPPGSGYHRHITFNDNTMLRILEFLREVADSPDYAFVERYRRFAAKNAFNVGIRCIVDSQIVVDGKRTVWCAQHDEIDLRPRSARSYELESLSGAESAAILKFLMSVDNPSRKMRRAIVAGAEWFESARITGIRVERKAGDRVVIKDPNAPPLWARFYEIETVRPFFCGRDGIKKYHLSEIEAERRSGYSWYGQWGKDVAASYVKWKNKWPEPETR
jgi:PelA/Pel-15E family pectate lyase